MTQHDAMKIKRWSKQYDLRAWLYDAPGVGIYVYQHKRIPEVGRIAEITAVRTAYDDHNLPRRDSSLEVI